MIVKSGDDLRAEQFAMQLIETMDQIWKKRGLDFKLTTYDILSTGQECGLLQFCADSMSIDQIKKKFLKVLDKNIDLNQLYKIQFEYSTNTKKYDQALDNFARSLAAYSLICYIL